MKARKKQKDIQQNNQQNLYNEEVSSDNNDGWSNDENNIEAQEPVLSNEEIDAQTTQQEPATNTNASFVSFDNDDNDYDESLAHLDKKDILVGQNAKGKQVLKIALPFTNILKTTTKTHTEFILRTPSEVNLHIADLYKNSFNIWKLAFDKNRDSEITADIEDLFKVLLYSNSDMSESSNNNHTTFLDTRLRNDGRVFAKSKLETANEPITIKMNIPYGNDLDDEIKAYKDSFSGNQARERLEMLEDTIKERIALSMDLADYACFNNFYLIFNNRDECKDKMLELFKVINYLFYKQLRTQEIIGDIKRRENNETTLQSSSDALAHLKELKSKVLVGSKASVMNGLGLEQVNSSITYSTDIVDFFSWKTKMLDWFCKIVFGTNIDLYYTKHSTNNKTNRTTLQNMINEPNEYRLSLLEQLDQNSKLVKNKAFIEYGKEQYVQDLLELLASYNYANNPYWDNYIYTLNNYKESNLVINGIKIQFSEFQYLVWLICISLRAVLHEYWNGFIVLKYCNTYVLSDINKLLNKFNGIRNVGNYITGYNKADEDWFKDKYLAFIDAIYSQNAIIFSKRFQKSIDKYILDYMKQDEEI